MRVLTDFHHSSLLRATNLLFGERLGMEVYRPIGMEWFEEGYWAINDQRDTAEQFLQINAAKPVDGTPALNNSDQVDWLTFKIKDPGDESTHRACRLGYFKQVQFDYVIASIPAHVPLFERLVAEFQPNAKLIVQIGNEWPLELFRYHNVLASVKPREFPDTNAVFYHQEFDTSIFCPTQNDTTRTIYSFVNILQNMPVGWKDFTSLEMMLQPKGFEFKSFGGQCRDGNMNGPEELAHKMHEAEFVFHVKDGGDGFGHIIYNAYAVGRPVIVRRSQYKDRLAEELLVDGTCIDLDEHNLPAALKLIQEISADPDRLREMGEKAARQFYKAVDYDGEARKVATWLSSL